MHGVVLLLLAIVIGEYIAVTWLAPQYVIRLAERLAGGSLAVNDAHLSFPLTTTFTGVHLISQTPDTLLSAQHVRILPRWFSASTRTLSLKRLDIDRPLLRLIRTEDGTLVWPAWSPSTASRAAAMVSGSLLRIHIESLRVEDGVIEFVDYKTPTPFHGVLHHVSFVAGPLTIPLGGPQMSFAVRGEVVGHGGEAAPIYCSGWCDIRARDLRASCKLEPLALSAFEPYFQQGPVKIRVYDTTVKSTSQWVARANELEGRLQIERGNIGEGDVSGRGRTVVDVKKLTEGEAPRLSAEFKITGPLDHPRAWRSDFVPGDAQAQQLVKPLLDRGIEIIKIPFGNHTLGVSITSANPDTMSGIEQASQQVERELEILAPPVPAVPSALASPPAAPIVEVAPSGPSSVEAEQHPPASSPEPLAAPVPFSEPPSPAKDASVQYAPAPAAAPANPSSDSGLPTGP